MKIYFSPPLTGSTPHGSALYRLYAFLFTPAYTALVFSFSHSASSDVKYGDIFSYTALW